MKCPKCGYIGFEQTDRCRNCGYDFVLVAGASPDPDLPLRKDDAGPLADFDLGEARRPAGEPGRPRRHPDPDLDPRVTPPARPAMPDLPLFGADSPDDLPIVPASAPTPPLAVRRSTPPAAKARPRPTPRAVEMPLGATLPLSDQASPLSLEGPVAPRVTANGAPGNLPGVGERILAGVVDWVLLLGLDAVVIYFTLKICRLAPEDVLVLPVPPLLAFLLLLNGGYLALLTAAGGQTVGKMAFKLKVVGADDRPVTVGRSIVRTLALLVSALPAGLGLLPTFFAAGHRGLHDQVAGTQVVRVPVS